MIFIFLKFTFNDQEQSYLADKYRGGNVMKIEDYWKDVTIYVTEFIVNQGTEKERRLSRCLVFDEEVTKNEAIKHVNDKFSNVGEILYIDLFDEGLRMK